MPLPIKYSIFATNLDKSNETFEVGLYDAVTLIGMAIAVVLGGIVAYSYGYWLLFFIAAGVNVVSIIPYISMLFAVRQEQIDYNYENTETN